MNLKKFLPGQDEKDTREYYWSLAVEPGWVQAGIWRIQDDKAQVVYAGTPAAWTNDEDLVNATDTTLSTAIQHFPEDLKEPSKTVFGVVSSWVLGGQIKEEYLDRIKKVCSELSLEPVGFVVLSEAVAHYYKADEGTPLNAVVIGVYQETLELSVFQLGNLLGNASVARSVSIADDVAEGLSRFAVGENIPSRFVLYNGKEAELEDARQSLVDVNWDEMGKLNFLHTPKIEIVDSVKKIHAVSLAGASEMADVTAVSSVDEDRLVVNDPSVVGRQIREKEEVETPEDFGFTTDVSADPVSADIHNRELNAYPEDLSEERFAVNNVAPPEVRTQPLKRNALTGILGKFTSSLGGITRNLPRLRKFSFAGNKVLFLGIASFLLIFLAGLGLWWFYPKATVTIYIAPQSLNERVEITVDPNAADTNIETRTLPGEMVSGSVSNNKTKSTTGTKVVGEKAKGEVDIYRVGTELTLPAGTMLHGPESLRFTLNDSVKVASGSAGTPAVVKASVTAEDIGSQYNLADGSTFRVGNYSTSDMEAKNTSSFSGGSSREIRVVSEEDQEELLEDLREELEENLITQMRSEVSNDSIFIEDSLSSEVTDKDFSNKTGDEASTLKLGLGLEGKAFTVDKSELVSIAREVLKDRIPAGYVLRDEQIEVDFQYKGKSGESFQFESVVVANLLPTVDDEEVAKKIAGKYSQLALDYLSKEVPGFVNAEIKLKPALPGRLGTLPRIAKNIEVEIAAER